MPEFLAAAMPCQALVKNRLLQGLLPGDLQMLWPRLAHVELKPRQILHHSGTPMESIYFIESGLVAVSAKASPGKWVEVWMIGSEGMTGLPVLLGDAECPPFRRVVQVRGSAFRISRADFQSAVENIASWRAILLRYTEFVLLQTSQSAICEAHHTLKQRLCRWLLMAHDALDGEDIPLTHQMLARLLGVRRASITECLRALGDEGALDNTRALICVGNRERLESLACDCHTLIRSEYRRLIK
ncbi:Crp/Fnr family transcriptional regulator [Microvirga sp. TS319]|uniref:Crp/Fnr family transcriptional regulator n=1 Tax=Microvirga sp. TS319 TaxID=3241165 RepID=UPI003519FAEC